MNDIFEANKALLETSRNLINKVKELKTENTTLKTQLNNSQNATQLTVEQKAEIEQLLQETQAVLNS